MLRKLLWVMLVLALGVAVVNAQDTIAIGDSVDGELEDGETVEYTFEAEQGTFLLISLESDVFDPFLTISDASGNTIATDDDSGDSTNALVRFTVPENGEYTIEVSGLFGGGGAFTLSLSVGEFIEISLGQTARVEFDGETNAFFFGYEGTAGEVITVSAVTDGSIDTNLTVFGPSGFEVASDEDSGENNDPLIQVVVLSEDGTYQIQLSSYLGSSVEGVVEVTVETAELTSLDDGETQEVNLFETSQVFFSFTAEEDVTYRLTFTAGGDASVFTNITIDGQQIANTSFNGVSQSTIDFTAETSGFGLVEITGFFFAEEMLEVSLAPVE